MTDLISVIVPAYNVERYLRECLDSIVNQTYKNLEILLINDGSTDSTLDICNEYKEKDNRIKVISQENRGVSSARNKGIINSKGKYLSFIDSDDYVDLNYVENLYLNMINDNCDYVYTSYIELDKEEKKRQIFNIDTIVENNKEALFNLIFRDDCRLFSSCMSLFKKSILLKNNILFEEDLTYGEDTLFVYNYCQHVNKYKYVNKYLYIYRRNGDSSSDNIIRKCDPRETVGLVEKLETKRELYKNNLINSQKKFYMNTLRHQLTSEVFYKKKQDRNEYYYNFKESIKDNKRVDKYLKNLDLSIFSNIHDKCEAFIIKHKCFELGYFIWKTYHIIK